MFKTGALIIFVLGLIYLIWPGPESIEDFPPIPGSYKSLEPGDTIQNPNIAAYFSQFDRQKITDYYKIYYENLNIFGLKIPSVHLNHPPELAYQYIRDQQGSTFLEELTYPLRDSIYVNGYEPWVDDEIHHKRHFFLADNIYKNGVFFKSKATLRYYPSPIWARVIVYIGIWISLILLIKLFVKILKPKL